MVTRSPGEWYERWVGAGLTRARRVTGRRKFYALVAYPGASGFFHVGHLRGYVVADALHRFHRLLGEESLFPFGVHASGIPAVAWSQKVRERDQSTVEQLREHGVPEDAWAGLEDPEAAARFLGHEYLRVLRSLGTLVDDSTFVTTVDEDYRAFIRWQFRALGSLGALGQGTHFASVCPVEGPVAVDPSETDLERGGDAEVVRFTTVPFRLDDGRVILAATLRPETLFGVTNLWLAPREDLVVWHRGEQAFVVASAGASRLVDQHGGHVGHQVPARELIGRRVRVPLREVEVPILESSLVDPRVGTGVVMSVPAHAPADAAALAALSDEERSGLGTPPVLLALDATPPLSPSEKELTAGEGLPSERALRAVGAKGLADADAVSAATERLYRLEFVRGRMTVPPLEGTPVREARDRVAADLRRAGESFDLQEFSKPVVCRNGHEVVIRRVPDQWFLRYGDPEWKAATRERLAQLTTWPEEYRRELEGILDWYQDRPCTRQGRWLGTRLPEDPKWVIEPIADSTFYMAYFIVRRLVASGRLRTDQLSDELFDYVFRGVGDGGSGVDHALRDELRAEFLYWYPLDANIGGKEHKRVHFPVFLYTHAKLLPPELQPRGIFVHGWITGASGLKLSKKEIARRGGRIPDLDAAFREWGPDAIRLYNLLAASPAADMEFDREAVLALRDRLAEVERLARGTRGDADGMPELDRWLRSQAHRWIVRAEAAFRAAALREAAELLYVEVPSILRRFYARGGSAGAAADEFGRAWIRFLSPITPFLAEELGEGRLEGLTATAGLPSARDFPLHPEAEAREAFLERVEEDLRAVLRIGEGRPGRETEEVLFFVAAPWKATVEGWMREALSRGETPSVREVMRRSAERPELASARAEIPRYVERVAPLLRSEGAPPPAVDEVATLRTAEGYLSKRLGFRSVRVLPEADAAADDPKGRRERARPGRPAFYLLGRPAHPS